MKCLFAAAIIAGLIVSCETDNGVMEMMNTYDSPDVSSSADSLQNCTSADSLQNCTCTDTIPNCACSDSTQGVTDADSTQNVNYEGTDQSFPYVSGTGGIATQTINLADFSEVELKKIGEVEIVSGSEYKVEISDYENLLPYAKVYLEGKRLVVSYDSVQVMGSKLKISVTIPDQLTKAIVSGSGNIVVNSGFATESVHLMVSGAGNITAYNINSNEVNIVLSGAGIIEAKGTAGNIMLDVKGSGTIKCKELMCNNAVCDIRGVSNVFVSVRNKLKVSAFAVGGLTYYGNPILEVEKGMLFSLIKG